eukprot:CAMPEP_0206581194 /NCGR_PEP_ID=MMETSP0325_2-20121206/33682_1 /ASSEMBLY_ACC=CAM_ASM_000347 /TAXON_ID=2866 /ORGANISM="Crypthecodinium cohnii, Strain Seligo" /LENGTH=263 /DNA_ID=CAMNT_0054087515 /DNA_START=68 /DNA_END=859 /DNA_ORIENTATION=-
MRAFSSFKFATAFTTIDDIVNKAATVTSTAVAAASAATATIATATAAVQASYAGASSSGDRDRQMHLEETAMKFPGELDELLEFSLFRHNFNYETTSQELIFKAVVAMRPLYPGESEEMLRVRATDSFAPEILCARWEARNQEWEAVGASSWESLRRPTSHEETVGAPTWELVGRPSSYEVEGEDFIICCGSEVEIVSMQDNFSETTSSNRSTPTSSLANSPEVPRSEFPTKKTPLPVWDGDWDSSESELDSEDSEDEYESVV